MSVIDALLERKLASLTLPLALVLPAGHRAGPPDAAVTLRLKDLGTLAHIASGEIGKVAQDYVEGRIDFSGSVRDLMTIATLMIGTDPTHSGASKSTLSWWQEIRLNSRSRRSHHPQADAQQIQFHYDVSDDFYSLWLDPRRIYSCAYFREGDMNIAQAQEAKLDHICRKLMLGSGERFLDVGAGWGGLLLWAAENYGVQGHGITLSKNQHAHVNRLIEEKGLGGRVRMELRDYRDMEGDGRYDKIASVGMFEHVGQVNMATYFGKLRSLLKPGGMVMNHGITSGNLEPGQLGAGMGDFIGKYIFPGGELLHVSLVLRELAVGGLEMVDVENLRPHYARTLWAWSDALEAQLGEAQRVLETTGSNRDAAKVLRAYRLYLAGSAMTFERGWLGLHQVLAR